MESELDGTIAVRNGLQLQVSELKNKLRMTDTEQNHEKRMRVRLQVLLERIRSHMTRCMSVLADHRALKAVVKVCNMKPTNFFLNTIETCFDRVCTKNTEKEFRQEKLVQLNKKLFVNWFVKRIISKCL